MPKTTHTARGTCQVCGAVQAIDNASGITAKHGYKVAGYGFFAGVCPGARFLPAEKSLDVTHKIIAQLVEAATAHDTEARAYRDFTVVDGYVFFGVDATRCTTYTVWDTNVVKVNKTRHGATYNTRGDYVEHAITAETPAHIVSDTQTKAAAIAEQNARYARSHVAMMREFIVPRLGQPFHAAKDVARAEAKVAKAKAIEGVAYPTQQSRKDALDKLNRAYDKARNELQAIYLAMPSRERTEAKTEIYYSAQQLVHWRSKHAEAALREFPQSADIVARINELVKAREAIKAAK